MTNARPILIIALTLTSLLATTLAGVEYQRNRALRATVLRDEQQIADLTERARLLQAKLEGARRWPASTGNSRRVEAEKNDIPVSPAPTPPVTVKRFNESPAQVTAIVRRRYDSFFQKCNFTPEKLAELTNVLKERQQLAIDAANEATRLGLRDPEDLPTIRKAVADAQLEANAQLQKVLGNENFALLQTYESSTPERNTIEVLKRTLNTSKSPLSDDQYDRMVDLLLKTEGPDNGGGLGRLVYGSVNFHSKITPQTLASASTVLSPDQVEALQIIMKGQIDSSGRAYPTP